VQRGAAGDAVFPFRRVARLTSFTDDVFCGRFAVFGRRARDRGGRNGLKPSAAILAEDEGCRIVPSTAVANHGSKGDPATCSESRPHFDRMAFFAVLYA
jgi:hypothetical protein